MAVGVRFGTSAGGRVRPGVPGTMPDVAPTPVLVANPVGHVEWRYPSIQAQMVSVPAFGGDCPVATLAAPPHGMEYVIEHIAITNYPNAGQVLIYAGDLDTGSIRDSIDAPTATILTGHYPNGLRLAATTRLHVLWFGPDNAAGYVANLQLRAEEV